jgi:hypothetical protein
MGTPDPDLMVLTTALGRLTGDAARLWHEPAARQRALDRVVGAWERHDDAGLARAVQRVDRAVVAGLQAVALPRGPVRSVLFDAFDRGWRGRKHPDCSLRLDAFLMRACLRTYQAHDDAFRTWVHESLHARQPFDPGFRHEWRATAGYEEGLAEGLARRLLRAQPGIVFLAQSFSGYVAAYETLAEVLGLSVVTLWRRLWQAPAGAVRRAFVDVLMVTTGEHRQRHLRQPHRILLQADAFFATDQGGRTLIDRDLMRADWERALR